MSGLMYNRASMDPTLDQEYNQYEHLHWVLVRETVEIEGIEFRQS